MKRLTDEQREIAARLYPRALELSALKARNSPQFRDEILSGAGLAAMEAACDPDQNIEYRTFYRNKSAIRRTQSRSWRSVPTPSTMRFDIEAPKLEDHESIDKLVLALRSLTNRQAEILDLVILRGVGIKGQGSASDRLGITYQAIQIHLRHAIKRMRIFLNG